MTNSEAVISILLAPLAIWLGLELIEPIGQALFLICLAAALFSMLLIPVVIFLLFCKKLFSNK